MIDIQMLRMMRTRTDFNKIVGSVTIDALEDKTRAMVNAIARYYKSFPDHASLDFSVFVPHFTRVYPKLTDDDKTVFKNIIANMMKEYPDESTRTGILLSLQELSTAHKVLHEIERFNNGEDVDIMGFMQQELDRFKTACGTIAMPEVDENIDTLLDDMDNDEGIKFRLNCINRSMRGLRGGDSIIFGARPDQGKTSFLASEASFMAPQIPDNRCILWLNNEGPGYAIRPRLMSAALGATMEDLSRMKDEGTLYKKYFDAVGGEKKIRVMDIHDYSVGHLLSLIENTDPAIIIYDMMDNVRGFGDSQRLDLRLESLYQWARTTAVKADAVAIMSSQISAEGANQMRPMQQMLKDSKTGKQGACEAILMMGSIEDKNDYVNTRWITAPKNKLRRTKSTRLDSQIFFDRDRSLFVDAQEVNKVVEEPKHEEQQA